MKHKYFISGLILEASFCVLMAVLSAFNSASFSGALAFPFEQIAFFLRILSLKGGVLNGAALLLYALISLLPVLYLLSHRKKGLHREDWLLPVLSALIFLTLYLMINPHLFAKFLQPQVFSAGESLPVAKAILGGTIYSGFAAYFGCTILKKLSSANIVQLQKYINFAFVSLAAVLVVDLFGISLQNLFVAIRQMNTMSVDSSILFLSKVFAIAGYIVKGLPLIFNISIIYFLLRFLSGCFTQAYSETIAHKAKPLHTVCKYALLVTVLSYFGFNLGQLAFSKYLLHTNYTLDLPLLSIIFVLAALIFTRIIEENHKLKQDNDSFI